MVWFNHIIGFGAKDYCSGMVLTGGATWTYCDAPSRDCDLTRNFIAHFGIDNRYQAYRIDRAGSPQQGRTMQTESKMEKAIWSVTGRVWNIETRQHDKLQTIDFERRVDATGFMSFNKNWIAGMVLDRNEKARIVDQAETR